MCKYLKKAKTKKYCNINNCKRLEQKRKTESTTPYNYVQDMLRDKLDTKVKIKDNKIEICFNNVNDLNRILEILDVKE